MTRRPSALPGADAFETREGSDLLERFFPEDVAYAELSPLVDGLPIDAREAALVSQATAKRQREFSAGRWLAREVLDRLGCIEAPLLSGPDRTPLWPAGIVGKKLEQIPEARLILAVGFDQLLMSLDYRAGPGFT